MLRSGLRLSLISLLISCISFVNQLVLASFFGSSLQMTGYLLGYSVPAVFTGVLTMLMNFSAVPTLVRWKESGDGLSEILGAFVTTMCLISAAVALFGSLLAAPLIHSLGGHPSPSIAATAVPICRVFWINAALSMISALYIALHNIEHRYAAPLLSSGLPYVGMIVTTVALGRTWGAQATALGMLAGTILSVVWLALTLRQSIQLPRVLQHWRRAQEFLKDSPLVALAITSFCAGSAIEAFWAMRLRPEDITYLGYSQRLVVVLASLVAFGPSAVLMTRLSELATSKNPEFRLVAAKALRMSLFATAPLALMLAAFAGPIVRVLFQRGAFDPSSTAGVSSVLPLAMVGSIALCASVMMMKALLASRQLMPAACIGLMQVAAYFVLAGILSRSFGLKGIITAFALSWWMALSAIILALWKDAWSELWKSFWAFAGGLCLQLLVLGGVMKLAASFFLTSVSSLGAFNLAIRVAACCALGSLAFAAVAFFVFRSAEMKLLLSTAGSKLRTQELVADNVRA